MKQFEYSRAESVAEALRLGEQPHASYLGGGTNLVDLMRYNVASPDRLIDLMRLPSGSSAAKHSLTKIEERKDGLSIGALVRNSDLARHPGVVERFPVLAEALLSGASPQIRNMATTAGNLLQRTRCSYFYDTAFPCNKRTPGSGCPAIAGINRMHAVLGGSDQCIAVHPSDMTVALAALDAEVMISGTKGDRKIPLGELHRLPGNDPQRDTTLEPGELITAVWVPASKAARTSTYLKVRDRASFAFALVSVAATVEMDGDRIRMAKFALGGVAPKPWRSHEAEAALKGKSLTAENLRDAAEIAMQGAQGYGHNDFKIKLAARAIVRAYLALGRKSA